jgi:cob(I)alamin adenosyltransferase
LAEKTIKRDLTSEPSRQGLIQVFTGDGKGKTSAALGNLIRALGHGLKVHIIFFLKGDYPYGERHILSQMPDVTVTSFGQEEFVDPAHLKAEQVAQAGQALAAARQAVLSGSYDLVILDEINVAAAFKLITVDDVLHLIEDKPRKLELILTGRLADARIIEKADLVTEMVKIKHPFDKGIAARKGFEY